MNVDILDQNRAVMDKLAGTTYSVDGLSDNPVAGSERATQKTLGQDEFFKLLTTQLASQDPLSPMEDTAFIAQMANFSELEMTSALTSSFEKFTTSQQYASSQGYIGKTVNLSDGSRGVVTSVEFGEDDVEIFLDGDNLNGRSVNMINRVELTGAINSASQLQQAAQQVIEQQKSQQNGLVAQPPIFEQKAETVSQS